MSAGATGNYKRNFVIGRELMRVSLENPEEAETENLRKWNIRSNGGSWSSSCRLSMQEG